MKPVIKKYCIEAINNFRQVGKLIFNREDIMRFHSIDPANTATKGSSWATTLSRLQGYSIARVPGVKHKNFLGHKALAVYRILEDKHGNKTPEDLHLKGVEKAPETTDEPIDAEPTLNYADIGKAIVERITSLQNENTKGDAALVKLRALYDDLGRRCKLIDQSRTEALADLEAIKRKLRVAEVKLEERTGQVSRLNRTIEELNQKIKVLKRTTGQQTGGDNGKFKLSELATIKTD